VNDEPTDTDLITGHPFTPGRPPQGPDECGYTPNGWTCGFAREEHDDQGGQP
jgi:hypothetical protein